MVPSIVAPQVLKLFARVVGCVAHVVHGGGVHLSAVNRLPVPHACIHLRVPAHDNADVFGWRPASISEDVDRDECKSSIAHVPIRCGGIVPGSPLSLRR